MANPKVQYLAEERRIFADKRIDFYAKHGKKAFIDDMQTLVASKQAPEVADLKEHLLIGNERAQRIISDFVSRFGPLVRPMPGEYMVVEKECVDSRAATAIIFDMLDLPRIHERTAASVVRKGPAFFTLHKSLGRGYVKTHFDCGGEAVAHDVHSKKKLVEQDEHLRSIVESIPYATACIEDPVLRCKQNARVQAENASGLLASGKNGKMEKRSNEIHPVMVSWQDWGRVSEGRILTGAGAVDVVWCSRTQADEDHLVAQMRENFKMLWGIAAELGRSPLKNGSSGAQYSHTIVFYDPFRLGLVNNPRVIFDMLPNEMFCVTEDFREKKLNNGSLSSSALGSLRYAGFLQGGHVEGVGKSNGTRHIMILDPDPKVMRHAKDKLVSSSEDIRELTKGGQTISLAKYDIETGKVEFIG